MILGVAFMVELLLSTAFGQGQVFLFGQMAASASSSRLPEIARMKTHSPLVSFKINRTRTFQAKTVLCNTDTKLNLSLITPESALRNLSASITSGIVPTGTNLKLSVKDPNENFNGNPGDANPDILLQNYNTIIISNIGSCYSGKNKADGYGLEYIYEIPSEVNTNLYNIENIITVTLTMTSEV